MDPDLKEIGLALLILLIALLFVGLFLRILFGPDLYL